MGISHEKPETRKQTQQVLAVIDNSGAGETAMHYAMVLPDSQGGGNPDRHSEICAKFNLSPACRDTCKQAMIEASDCKNVLGIFHEKPQIHTQTQQVPVVIDNNGCRRNGHGSPGSLPVPQGKETPLGTVRHVSGSIYYLLVEILATGNGQSK